MKKFVGLVSIPEEDNYEFFLRDHYFSFEKAYGYSLKGHKATGSIMTDSGELVYFLQSPEGKCVTVTLKSSQEEPVLILHPHDTTHVKGYFYQLIPKKGGPYESR